MKVDVWDVARAAQLASMLEVSGYPKPGNVHRTANSAEATFEEFVASSVAIGPVLLEVAKKGFDSGRRNIPLQRLRLGEAVKQAISDTMRWQKNGNTNLGIALLLVPLTAAAGMTLARNRKIDIRELRKDLVNILESTTPDDAINVYDAILTANPAGLGSVTDLDVMDVRSKNRILEKRISLYNIMKASSDWDNISKEWGTGMRITFEFGYPLVKRTYRRTGSINATTVQTFMEILAEYPDTLVQRIYGETIAARVTQRAKTIVAKGGMLTNAGMSLIKKFDRQLKRRNINPGTTADLTASSLMLAIIDGLRP